MLNVGKVVKVIVQVAVGAAVGVMANDFAKKYVAEPLQKFADSKAEKAHN